MRVLLAISERSRVIYIRLQLPGPWHISSIAENLIMTAITAFNYGVNCHQIKLKWHLALIFTVKATPEGRFAPLEGYWCHLQVMMIVLLSVLAQYCEPLIVYIISFLVEIHHLHSHKHRKLNQNVFSIQRHQLHVHFPLLGVGSQVEWLHCWDNGRTTQFALSWMSSEW